MTYDNEPSVTDGTQPKGGYRAAVIRFNKSARNGAIELHVRLLKSHAYLQ